MNRRALWAILGAVAVLVAGVGAWLLSSSLGSADYAPPGPVTVQEAHQLIQRHGEDEDFVIVDVRTASEFNAGHLATNGARLLNIDVSGGNFRGRVDRLSRDRKLLVYCRTGNRSQVAVEAMESAGFAWVYHMDRGIVAWQAAGLPVVAE